MKKILIILVLSCFSFSFSFAATTQSDLDNLGKEIRNTESKIKDIKKDINNPKIDGLIREDKAEQLTTEKEKLENLRKQYENAYEKFCDDSGACFQTPEWGLNVKGFTPGGNFAEGDISDKENGSSIQERFDTIFEVVIKNLMIALGIISVIIMTIGGGYMILNSGQEELLNKGKSIFMAGIYSMIIALASYYLVQVIADLVYTQI